MSVLLPYKYKIEKKEAKKKDIHQFPNNMSMGMFPNAQGQPQGGSGRVSSSSDIFMVGLVIYRIEEDPIENESA